MKSFAKLFKIIVYKIHVYNQRMFLVVLLYRSHVDNQTDLLVVITAYPPPGQIKLKNTPGTLGLSVLQDKNILVDFSQKKIETKVFYDYL